MASYGPVEVCHDDWNGQSDTQDSTDGAQRGHKLPRSSFRRNISVACNRDSQQSPSFRSLSFHLLYFIANFYNLLFLFQQNQRMQRINNKLNSATMQGLNVKSVKREDSE